MAKAVRYRLARTLSGDTATPFSVCMTMSGDALDVHVEGFGRVPVPVTRAATSTLARLARKASCGSGAQTPRYPEERRTWEVPLRLVRAEWNPAVLRHLLSTVEEELGLPGGFQVTAGLRSLAVREEGLSFMSAPDPGKPDNVIGTLMAVLPSTRGGSELNVDGVRKPNQRGSRQLLAVAFDADDRHEIYQLTAAHQITLSYDLLLHAPVTWTDSHAGMVAELASLLREHFSTPEPRTDGDIAGDTPARLTYLLNGRYTAKALDWSLLKDADDRAGLLREAADEAGCETVLGFAEVTETRAVRSGYDALPDDYDALPDDEDDSPDGDERVMRLVHVDAYLTHCAGRDGEALEEISLHLRDTEICASDYTGYTGNERDIAMRMSSRAAVLVWPRERAFANRAELDPAWALEELTAMAASGDVAGARTAAGTLGPFWATGGSWESRSRYGTSQGDDMLAPLLGKALRAADSVGEPDTAAMLLRPFTIGSLTDADAIPLAAVAGRYGQDWTTALLRTWFGQPLPGQAQRRQEWAAERLTGICRELAAAGDTGAATARQLLDLVWERISDDVTNSLDRAMVYRSALSRLGESVAAVLMAAAVSRAPGTRDAVARYLRDQRDLVAALELYAVRAAGMAENGTGDDDGFGALAADCTARLHSWLAPA
ncbi:MAG TPA: hypothetical protein VG142_18975 [Trebonia sp.]|nr:hypothetical protein [Trebonia sp.]